LAINYQSLFDVKKQHRVSAVMAARAVDDVSRYGGLILDGENVTGFCEKGVAGAGWINAGVYLMDSDLFRLPIKPMSLERELVPDLVAAGAVRAVRCNGYFIDIGIPTDLEKAQADFNCELPYRGEQR